MKPQPRGTGCVHCARPDQWGASSDLRAGRPYPGSSKGVCQGGGKLQGKKVGIPEIKVDSDNGQVQEHVDMIRSVLAGKPLSHARRIAEVTMAAIIGRTFHDMIILAVARGLNVHTKMRDAWWAINAYGYGGDVCPRNLEAARDIARRWLLAGRELTSEHEQFHLQMARIYQMGVSHKVKGFEREDLAVAYAVYSCATDAKCMKWLQWFHRGYFPGFQRDIAKAYVTAKLAHEMKDDYTIGDAIRSTCSFQRHDSINLGGLFVLGLAEEEMVLQAHPVFGFIAEIAAQLQ